MRLALTTCDEGKRQNPQASHLPCGAGRTWGFRRETFGPIRAEPNYFKMASLNAFDARRRTTVLALILIASPVAGLRPMRALRCAFTARPIPGMTNLPAPLASFTASLNSSSKNDAACFFEIGFSGELTLSAMWAIILDLLNGVAIEFYFLLRCKCFLRPPASGMPAVHYSRPAGGTQGERFKKPGKTGVFPTRDFFGRSTASRAVG